ncbi:MAG TPA: T9SS type A sorting domain-containing protein [Ignavibacteria bacterium]|nr:T9SS type A sorting domain-containing protein [Ignavibacteria bacterium]
MKFKYTGYKIPFFVLLIAAVVFSFNGSFEFSGDRDIDAIASENLNPVNITISTGAPVTNLNTSSQLNKFINFTTDFSLADTITLPANPGPANNGLSSAGAGMLFNLIGGPRDLYVTAIKTALSLTAGAPVRIEVYIRDGNALGGPVGSGPGSSLAGWTCIDTADGFQGPVANGISELINIGPIPVPAGDTVGVALKLVIGGPRYFGTGTPPLENYLDTNLRLITGDARSAVFTTGGTWFSSRALTGELRYVVSTTTGITNLNTGIPEGFKLSQNYPNPFNPSTNIEFAIPVNGMVTLKIHNINGKEVAVLANGEYSAGSYMVNWNASSMASGVYFYTIQSGGFTQTKKLLLVK